MLAGAVFFGGCSASYSGKATDLRSAWQQGNFALAEEIVAEEVRDADDNRYVIEDYRKLDSHSRRLLMADL